MEQKKFSWRARGNSFSFAWSGLKALFTTEHNAWIHFALTLSAVALGFVLQIGKAEALALVIVITVVWVAEIFNTAIEKVMDFISVERNPQIERVKDLSAAAVLLAAVAAVITGCIIFIPKIISYA